MKIKIYILDSIHANKIWMIIKDILNKNSINNEIIILEENEYPVNIIDKIKDIKPDYIVFEHWFYHKWKWKYYPLWWKFLDLLYSNFLIEEFKEKQKETYKWFSLKSLFSIFSSKKEEISTPKVNNFYSKLISINPQWNKIRNLDNSYNKFTIHWFIKDKSPQRIAERIISLEKR